MYITRYTHTHEKPRAELYLGEMYLGERTSRLTRQLRVRSGYMAI